MTNTTYLSLDEHLVIFVVDQFSANGAVTKKNPEVRGTRREIEKKLMELLFSLKYYSTRWRRAKTYAELVGFLHTDESHVVLRDYNKNLYVGTLFIQLANTTGASYRGEYHSALDAASGVNDFNFDEAEIPDTDIYTQDFFFYGYSFLSKESKGFIESTEGYTYVKSTTERR